MLKKRTVSLLLALLMVLVLLPITTAQADGEIEISTYEQLKEFAARVNARETGLNAKLTANITCTDKTWTPIGDDHFRYDGTFDGQGYKIIGLSNADVDYSGLSDLFVYIGLFGKSYGTVKNVVIEDCDLSFASDADGYVYMGAVVGRNDGTVEACSVSGKLSAALTSYSVTAGVGGVVGDNKNTVKTCTNSGAVSVSVNNSFICVGGVVGNDDSSVQNCANTGAVSGAGHVTVGGIAGYSESVKNCFNTGAISGENGPTGGIVGYTSYGTVENCLNVGTVTGVLHTGGVIGQNSYGTVKTCLSVGAVSGSGRYIGGVVGMCPDNASVKSYVENCYCLDTSASAAIGNAGSAVVTSVSALTAEQLKSIENCAGFSTEGGWYEGLYYPVQTYYAAAIHLYANSNEDLVIASYLPAFVPTKIANPFTYADHDFTGWNTDPDGNGDPYSEDDTFTLQPGEALTLHAQWKEADPVEIGTWADLDAALKAGGKYTLTADVAPENPYWADALTVPSGVTVTLDLNGHIVDRGYTEQGWDGSILIVSGNLTLLDSDPTATHDPAVTYTDPVTGREITVNGGILKGGWPDQYGGGVQVQGGAVRMEGGSIACNSVGKNGFGAVAALGGGVYIQSGTFLMSGGAIVGNKAVNKNTMMPDNPLGRGGAVYIANGVFTLTGGLIRGNTAGEAAGGIYMGDHGYFVMTGGTIVGNTAPGMNNVFQDSYDFSIDLAWITLNSNDGNGYVSEQTFTLNDTAPIATDIFVRDGYEFTGWNTKAEGSGTPYADGADFYAGAENIGLALYAQWKQIVFPITFVNEDGTELQSGPVAVGETPVYEGETPTKAPTVEHLYTFAGWKLQGTETVLTVLPAVTGEATYVAAFTESDRVYTGPVWAWTGCTKATATFTAADDTTFTQTVTAEGSAITNKVTTDPTCTESGERTYTATVTFLNETYTNDKTEPVDPIGHDWAEPTYEWADDNSTVTATRVCKNDSTHIETETVETIYAVIDEPQPYVDGLGHYTSAAFENPAFAVQEKDVVIPMFVVTYVGSETSVLDSYGIVDGERLFRFDVRLDHLIGGEMAIDSMQIFLTYDHAKLTFKEAEGVVDWTVNDRKETLAAVWASDGDVTVKDGDLVLTLYFAAADGAEPGTFATIAFTESELHTVSALSYADETGVKELEAATVDGGILLETPLYGDANCDGAVTAADAALILRSVVGLSAITLRGAVNADVDGDLSVTAADAAAILRYVVGLIQSLPVE